MLTDNERTDALAKIAKGRDNIDRLLSSELPLELIYFSIRLQARINHRLAIKLKAKK